MAQKRIGYRFRDEALLAQALSHRSAGAEEDNERLEFLGDRVLGLVVAEALMARYPQTHEGDLSKRLAALVSRDACSAIARGLGIGEALRYGGKTKKPTDKMLADACEAVIGAVYLDGGYAVARDFVLQHWEARFEAQIEVPVHPKMRLQEWAARCGYSPPVYEIVDKYGPDHAPKIKVAVRVPNVGACQAIAGSRSKAEAQAAQDFLDTYAEGAETK